MSSAARPRVGSTRCSRPSRSTGGWAATARGAGRWRLRGACRPSAGASPAARISAWASPGPRATTRWAGGSHRRGSPRPTSPSRQGHTARERRRSARAPRRRRGRGQVVRSGSEGWRDNDSFRYAAGCGRGRGCIVGRHRRSETDDAHGRGPARGGTVKNHNGAPFAGWRRSTILAPVRSERNPA